MTKSKPPKPKKGGLETDEDAGLWDAMTSMLEPLPRKKARVGTHEVAAPIAAPGQNVPRKTVKREQPPALRRLGETTPPPTTQPKKQPPLADYDAKKARRIGSGRTEIERRIDLHGMRQSEAHGALRNFLFACHAAGLRDVLVITGKGGPGRRRDDDHQSHWPEREERGVLRRSVPLWLSEPDLRAIIVSYTPAAIRHGGDGALYIHLRRRDRV